MTRPIQEILDNADEIARRFEEFDPDQASEVPVEEYLAERVASQTCDRPD